MNANLALNKADNKVSQSINRLSSGLKVASAKDSPSGYALSKRMNMQIEGISRATQSANDSINIISIADGALQEVSDMIQRMSELATKAANGTMTDEDRKLCQDELDQLKKEIKRVADTTEFNGQTLMDGSFDVKGYTNNLDVLVATYSDATPVSVYEFPDIQIEYTTVLDKDGFPVRVIDEYNTLLANDSLTFPDPFPEGTKVGSASGTLINIVGPDDFSITLDVEELVKAQNYDTSLGKSIKESYHDPITGTSLFPGKTSVDLKGDITGLGPMDMQIGANEDQILSIRIPQLSLKLMGIENSDISTEDGAGRAIENSKQALKYVNDMRSRLGAYQNRLEHTVASLDVTNEALTGAYSGLVDADMAEETVQYSTSQIISQAATSVLAQANDRPSQALQLLQ